MKLSIRIYELGPEKFQLDLSSGRRRVRTHVSGDRFTAEEQRRLLLKMNTEGEDVFDYLDREKVTRAAPKLTQPTLRQAVSDWIAGEHGRQGATIRTSTVKSYQGAVTTWLYPHRLVDGRVLGDLMVTQVTRGMLQAVLDRVRGQRSRERATHISNPLKTMFAKLLKDEVVTIDPTVGLELGPKPESAVEVFSSADQDALIRAAERTSTAGHAFVLAGLQGGLRWAEISGLQRGDIDFAAHTLRVSRQWDRYAKQAGPLKTKRARRVVPMAVELEAALQRHCEAHELVKPSAWLFASSSGRPLDASTWRRRVWGPLLQRAGVAVKTFHATRHTAATTMLRNGIPLHAVSRALGHANVGVTDATYSHVVPTDYSAAIVAAFSRGVRT